jgi:hypothetical protein
MTRQLAPKGTWNRCPKCRTRLHVKGSAEIGRAGCAQCGASLWFRTIAGFWNWLRTCHRPGTRLYDGPEVEAWHEQVIDAVVGMTDLTAEQVRSKIKVEDLVGADSLDIVELVMQLEDDFKNQ